MPIFAEVLAGHRAGQGRHRLLVLRLVGLPGRPGVLVRLGGGRDRGVPADHGVARGDGRRLGAVRGLGEDPHRRGGHRAGLRVRQVVRGPAAPGAGPAARPLPGRAALAGLGQHRRAAGPARASRPGAWSEKDMAEVAARSRAAALSATRRRSCPARSSAEDLLGPALRRRPAPGARLRAGRRRGRGGDPGLRPSGPASCARGPPGSPGSSTGSTRRRWAARDLTTAPSAAAAGAGGGRRPASTSPNCTRRSPTRRSSCAARWGWATESGSIPSGGALCGNPMFAAGLARIGMAAREITSGRRGRALGHATSGPALQQNLVCVMEAR